MLAPLLAKRQVLQSKYDDLKAKSDEKEFALMKDMQEIEGELDKIQVLCNSRRMRSRSIHCASCLCCCWSLQYFLSPMILNSKP